MDKLLLAHLRAGSRLKSYPRAKLAIIILASASLLSACGGSKDRDKPVQASSVTASQGAVEAPSSSASVTSSSAEPLTSVSSSLAVLSSSRAASSEIVAVSSSSASVSSAGALSSQPVCLTIGGCVIVSSASSVSSFSQSSVASLSTSSWSSSSSASSIPKQASLDHRNLRLLTREEYLNSVRDLFPSVTIDGSVMDSVPADGNNFNFATASTLALDYDRALGYQMAAEAIAKQVMASTNSLFDLIHACRQLDILCQVGLLGEVVFRRPLSSDEATRYAALYDAADGGKAVIQGLLTSPHFLYRSEMGEETSPGSGLYRLTNYEIASLLSYSLWASTPDVSLLSSARAGNLDIKAQVKRMLADPRAERGLRRFVKGWLLADNRGYSAVESPTLAAAFEEESIRFVTEMIKADQPYRSLLTANYTYANTELAQYYGSSPVSGWAQSTFADNDPRHSTGILAHGSFLASRISDAGHTSPTQRGKFVREQLLCQTIAGHTFMSPARQSDETNRTALVRLTADPTCNSCHQSIDGIGFGFEVFGSNAKYRTQERLGNGQLQNIDASGWISGLDSAETKLDFLGQSIAFTRVSELAELIANSKLASACYSRQYYRYIVGRNEEAIDESIIPLYSAKLRAGGGMLEMLSDLTTHPSFILRR
ncbi:MAG TPA: DUF1592 domain-containing protein [Cellvibrio sp.]|nr:DUF1592 domain-containing protein [Cellvibrio sp.]